jgi:hypothetical protein
MAHAIAGHLFDAGCFPRRHVQGPWLH